MNPKIDKTLAASIALHVLVIGWGLVSFSTRAFESKPEESVTVDVVSASALAKAGAKTGSRAGARVPATGLCARNAEDRRSLISAVRPAPIAPRILR